MTPARKKRPPRPEWAVRIERFRKNELRITGTAFGKVLGVSAMAVSRWENGDNEPPGECYAKMGNMAPAVNTRLYFWQRAGIDIEVLSSTEVPSSGRPALKSPSKRPQKT
jgi:transcriptional regulator with XRE-family HTH domain